MKVAIMFLQSQLKLCTTIRFMAVRRVVNVLLNKDSTYIQKKSGALPDFFYAVNETIK